jgi:hypothetical protein
VKRRTEGVDFADQVDVIRNRQHGSSGRGSLSAFQDLLHHQGEE